MDDPTKLDIYVAVVRLNEAGYSRPCIVIEQPLNDRVLIAPISSALDLFSASRHFLLESSAADFHETGLDRTSFIVGDDLQNVKRERLVKKIGRLSGKLAKDFHNWMG